MKVLAILCAAILTATSFVSRGAVATMSDDEFNPKATEWAEGVVTSVKDGRVQLSGAKSGYAGDFAAFHREFFSFPETERELQRKKLQERFQSRMAYHASKEKPLMFTFSVPDAGNTVVFDEAANYGTTLSLWKFPEKTTLYKFNDLKPGDRVVVGYDSSEQVHSIMRVNPVILMSGENNEPPKAQVSDLVDKNGVHIMNKSSNETNPIPPYRPNRPTMGTSGSTTSADNANYNRYNDYPLVIPPTQSSTNQTWNDANYTNDARTQPPNSRSPNAPPTVQTGQQDPPLSPGSGQHINSTDGTPNQSRAGDNQTYPNQFNRPDNPNFNQPSNQPNNGRLSPNQPNYGQPIPNQPNPNNGQPSNGSAQPNNNQPPPVQPNSGQPVIPGRSMAQPRP